MLSLFLFLSVQAHVAFLTMYHNCHFSTLVSYPRFVITWSRGVSSSDHVFHFSVSSCSVFLEEYIWLYFRLLFVRGVQMLVLVPLWWASLAHLRVGPGLLLLSCKMEWCKPWKMRRRGDLGCLLDFLAAHTITASPTSHGVPSTESGQNFSEGKILPR